MKEQAMDIKVSVIIPTYNRAHLIGRAIESVLNQSYRNFELIIVDDGSGDNTADVIEKFTIKDKRVRYIRHEDNRGGAAARNTGIRAARGDYVAFQDDDDEWFPAKLEKQMDVFQTAPENVGVVYTGFWRIENDKKEYIPISFSTKKEGAIYKEVLKGSFIDTPSLLVKKECFDKSGTFDENLMRLQDWDLVLRLAKHYHFKYIDKPMYNAYYSPGSSIANSDAYLKALEFILKKYLKDFKLHRQILANHYFQIGSQLCPGSDFKKGRNYFIRAARIYPFNIDFLITAVGSFFGQKFCHLLVGIYWKIKIFLKHIKNKRM